MYRETKCVKCKKHVVTQARGPVHCVRCDPKPSEMVKNLRTQLKEPAAA